MGLSIQQASDGLSASLSIGGTPSVILNKYGLVSGLSGRQKLINGDFSINQLVISGTVTLSAGAYGHDMWKAGAGGCTYTFSTTTNVTTITISAGTLLQIIKGQFLHSGTYTLSWGGTSQARIDTGTYGNSGLQGTAVGETNQTVEFGTGTVILPQYEPGTIATLFEYRMNEMALAQTFLFPLTSVALGFTNSVYYPYAPTVFFPAMSTTPTLVSGSSYAVGSGSAGTVAISSASNTFCSFSNSAGNWTTGVTVSVSGLLSTRL